MSSSQSKSQDLATTITAASTSSPPTIAAAITAVESFLHHHTADQSRWFFSITFPTLISKIFGFSDSSSAKSQPPDSWIDSVTDPNLAGKIFDLLSPNGALISAILSIDQYSLVKFVFPVERLPEWVKFMLNSERDSRVLSDLCPMLKGRIVEDSIKGSFQVQLNVFEYYMFWFAYYPVCKGNCENNNRGLTIRKSRISRFENWTNLIPGLMNTSRRSEQKDECNLYTRLLYSYLRAFVPKNDFSMHQPYRSSLLHYSQGYDGPALLQAEFLVYTLIHFWLVDNDFSPLPVSLCKSFGVSFSFRSVFGETPPTPGLGDIVKIFVKYLNVSLAANTKPSLVNGSPRWRMNDSVDVLTSFGGSWISLSQRPLYRFILRTFLFCPMGSSMKNASQVFSLWVCYMEPWLITLDDMVEHRANGDEPLKSGGKEENGSSMCGYSSSWQGYVLSNYLFYSSLVMHFIGFAHKFLHTNPEVIVQMVLKVINILTSSRELIDLIKDIDTVFHSNPAGSRKSMLNSLQRCVPPIREQLQDWEDGLCESDVDGSFLHENWNKDLRLFSDGDDGGQRLLQLFILRAESELQAILGDNLANSLQNIYTLKSQVGLLFGHILKPVPFCLDENQPHESRDEIFTPRRVNNKNPFSSIKYRGDWMKRPICEDEVTWLAKLLVQLSEWLNENLGLNRGDTTNPVGPSCPYVEVPGDVVSNVSGSVETMKVVLYWLSSWVLMLGMAGVGLMKKHGLRVNLRVLASKKVLMVFVFYLVFSLLKKAFRLALAI